MLSKIETIISEFGAINLESGDWCDYPRNHDYRMVYAVAKTKKSAVEKILKVSGMLEISQFHSFYPDKQYFQEWEFVDELDKQDLMYQKYNQINQFLNQNFSKVTMYRFSFEIFEKIYIFGETKNCDRAGICIKSNFVYNP